MGDDRRRSWRELDRARERGGGGRRDPDARNRERAEKSGAYGAYKAQLEKMFSPGGGGLPDHLKEQLGPVSEASAARQKANADFRSDPTDAHLEAFLQAGLELPDDARFLMTCLDRLEREDNLRRILDKLLSIVESGRRPNRMLLIEKLRALEPRLEEDASRGLLADLRDAL